MRHPMRAFALACALAALPACTTPFGGPRIENPVTAARTIDQRAYALLHAYAAILEEASDIVAEPAIPASLRRALGQAERAATPAVETLQIAVGAYVRAQADFDAASDDAQPVITRAATALSVAAQRLNEAIAAARGPIGELEHIVRARRA